MNTVLPEIPHSALRTPHSRKPSWLKMRIPGGTAYSAVRNRVDQHKLHTVCESAKCPNMGECWAQATATFMILGDTCTRSCGFCAVKTGRPTELDLDEPQRVADAVRLMGLKYVVITSVTRDELSDGGSSVWAATIRAVRETVPHCRIETLIPDFKGLENCLNTVLQAKPDILNHNVETVPRLHSKVRPQAKYPRSLQVLERAKAKGFFTKTSMMLGIGEEPHEVEDVMQDLQKINVDIVTFGQYLQPTAEHLPVDRYVTPDEFAQWKRLGLDMGFRAVESGPLVRSSYHADEQSKILFGS
jgi:lipoic acid synthetase